MNKSRLKSYAAEARGKFLRAMEDRAFYLGVTESSIEPAEKRGDLVFISNHPFKPQDLQGRKELIEAVNRKDFKRVIQEVAYTWFNRFAALRYLELHDYLDHGLRVLSNRSGSTIPEILEKADAVDLPGIDREKIIELKIAGKRDAELYRMLLLAQCRQLGRAMPFLFPNNGTKYLDILLPENLLLTNSILRSMVEEIPEDDWSEVEIIGWLYQFFISERKDEVIGKVVKSEDIPAATQLFTPNWIVKYLVQNSLGRLWLEAYPESALRGRMEYYIEPAEQEPEVQKQLEEIRPKELNPEELKLLDPACGSGHILIEAFKLLYEIYSERGYQRRDIPRQILEKNLYGLDICGRAAQLAGFALMMEARKYDREILDKGVRLNVLEIRESNDIAADELHLGDENRFDVQELINAFQDAKTFGSLISIDPYLIEKLGDLKEKLEEMSRSGKLHVKTTADQLLHLYCQAETLAGKYDAVVANPPYMGNRAMNATLKTFAKREFKNTKSDLFAMFIERGLRLSDRHRYLGLITMQSWMFLSSFEKMREHIINNKTILTMAHLGARAFSEISGEVVQTTAFVLVNENIRDYKPSFFRLLDGNEEEKRTFLLKRQYLHTHSKQSDFKKIPGSPIAYWASDRVREIFKLGIPLSRTAKPLAGVSTGDNNTFERNWHEVSVDNVGFRVFSIEESIGSGKKWFPCNSGGQYRKWYGNNEIVIDWEKDGIRIRNFKDAVGHLRSAPRNTHHYFRRGITWTKLSSSRFAARYREAGFIFDDTGRSAFTTREEMILPLLALLCSNVATYFLRILNPSMSFTSADIGNIPLEKGIIGTQPWEPHNKLVDNSRNDWDSFETSWDFQRNPLLTIEMRGETVRESYKNWEKHSKDVTAKMKELEEENNRIFIEAYGLQEELTPDVPLEQITLTVNPFYRYKMSEEEVINHEEHEGHEEEETERVESLGDLRGLRGKKIEALWERFRLDTIKELISYSIGCMMGRYSLDRPGLAYAHAGNEGFDPSLYSTFPADDDGIIPVTDIDWFDDDAAVRFRQFISVAWPEEHLDENMRWIAESLGRKADETPLDTVRRYLSRDFYKDHCKTYKKRPIYWLFSSGKEKAFDCLVYLHRYNEDTLSRMRTSYVVPLQSKLAARISHLNTEIGSGTSSRQSKLQKELDRLQKKQKELIDFEELLRHYADQRIKLDLDDGVKANYQKFGKLPARI